MIHGKLSVGERVQSNRFILGTPESLFVSTCADEHILSTRHDQQSRRQLEEGANDLTCVSVTLQKSQSISSKSMSCHFPCILCTLNVQNTHTHKQLQLEVACVIGTHSSISTIDFQRMVSKQTKHVMSSMDFSIPTCVVFQESSVTTTAQKSQPKPGAEGVDLIP